MNQDDLTRLALIYGADISRWPDDVRTESERLIRATPELESIVRGAAQLDAAIKDQQPHISEHRLAKLKAETLTRAHTQRVAAQRNTGLFGARFAALARQWSWATAGLASALCMVAMLQLTLSERAPASQNAMVSVLEYETGLLEMLQ